MGGGHGVSRGGMGTQLGMEDGDKISRVRWERVKSHEMEMESFMGDEDGVIRSLVWNRIVRFGD